MGGKKQKRAGKAAAATAAHAASKKKASAVEVSADNEARLRGVLESLDLSAPSVAASASASAAPGESSKGPRTVKQLRQKLEDVYEELLRHAFEPPQVQVALLALPISSLSAESALDWLCFHLEARDLPPKLAEMSRTNLGPAGSSSAVRIRLKAEEGLLPAQQPLPADDPEADKAAAAARAKAEESRQKDEQRRKEEEDGAEAARRKVLIMQYAEAYSEDGSEEEEEAAGDESIEDWELQMWADPREVERRCAERARAKIPPEVRRSQEASLAKVAGNKARQKGAGQIIRELKQEMAALGLTEQDLEPDPEPEPVPKEVDLFDSEIDISEQQSTKPEEGLGSAGAGDDFLADNVSDECKQEKEREEGRKSEEEEEEEDNDPLDLFGDEEEVAAAMGCTLEEMASMAGALAAKDERITDPWLLSQGYGGSDSGTADEASRKGKKAPPAGSRVAAPPAPKALLQQHCQRMGWPTPRFEKLGYVDGDRVRYKVIVAASGGPKLKGKHRSKVGSGDGSFMLREAEDGWGSVQEAQSAAAAYALWCLMPDQPLHTILAEPYSSLMRSWQADERATGEAEARASEKDVIINKVLATKAAELPPSAGVGPETDRAAPPDASSEPLVSTDGSLVEDSWQELVPLQQAATPTKALTPAEKAMGKRMAAEQRNWEASEEGKAWAARRAKLPVATIRDTALEALERGDLLVISGDTGCGKTTQVPQYILESELAAGRGSVTHIICTQPRRIAAVSVAERVADERGEPLPGKRGGRVGYHVRLDSATTEDTRLTFCTTGILLRRLAGDGQLSTVSHVVVDEVHERTLQGDFLMALLKQLVPQRRAAGWPLKVVLMSATLDAALFASYFGGAEVLNAAGRTFPVTRYFLEDCYEMTAYKLEADSPAALREGSNRSERKRLEHAAGNDKSKLVRAGWGDDADDAPLNPDYDPELYAGLSASARRNLARVDEHRIDFDLLEELVVHIDEKHEGGAVLVFLPGMGEISALYERLVGSFRFRGEAGSWVLPLHSSVSPEEQRRAFDKPPAGQKPPPFLLFYLPPSSVPSLPVT